MASDNERMLIAPCGLYCGYCVLYRARTDQTLRQKMAEQQGIPVKKVPVCIGCKPAKGDIKVAGGTTTCDTYACAVNDKKVEFCYQCQDFPCLKLAPCADRAQEIPHNTKVYSLILLQKLGVDAWLEGYDSRFRQYMRGKKPRPGGDIQL